MGQDKAGENVAQGFNETEHTGRSCVSEWADQYNLTDVYLSLTDTLKINILEINLLAVL